MNINVTFHIVVDVYKNGKLTKYRMLVDHYYSSDQVERFKVHGKNDKHILMERKLNVHKQPWKLLNMDISGNDIKSITQSIRDIQLAIDRYLEQRDGEREGHVTPNKKG